MIWESGRRRRNRRDSEFRAPNFIGSAEFGVPPVSPPSATLPNHLLRARELPFNLHTISHIHHVLYSEPVKFFVSTLILLLQSSSWGPITLYHAGKAQKLGARNSESRRFLRLLPLSQIIYYVHASSHTILEIVWRLKGSSRARNR
jgi:hypothetical protein